MYYIALSVCVSLNLPLFQWDVLSLPLLLSFHRHFLIFSLPPSLFLSRSFYLSVSICVSVWPLCPSVFLPRPLPPSPPPLPPHRPSFPFYVGNPVSMPLHYSQHVSFISHGCIMSVFVLYSLFLMTFHFHVYMCCQIVAQRLDCKLWDISSSMLLLWCLVLLVIVIMSGMFLPRVWTFRSW